MKLEYLSEDLVFNEDFKIYGNTHVSENGRFRVIYNGAQDEGNGKLYLFENEELIFEKRLNKPSVAKGSKKHDFVIETKISHL